MSSLFSEDIIHSLDIIRSLFSDDRTRGVFEDIIGSLFPEDRIRRLLEDTIHSLLPGGISESFINTGGGIQNFSNATIIIENALRKRKRTINNSHSARLEVDDSARLEVNDLIEGVRQRVSAPPDRETFHYIDFVLEHIASEKYSDVISKETMQNLQNLHKRYEVYNLLEGVRQRVSEAPPNRETFHYIDFVVEHIASKNYSDVIPSETMQKLQNLHKQSEVYNLLEEVRQRVSKAPRDQETFHYIDFVVEHIASKNYSDVIPSEKMQELQSLHKQSEVYILLEEVRQRVSEAPPNRETFHYIDFVVEHISSKNYSDVIPSETMQKLQNLHKQSEVYNLLEEVRQRVSKAPRDQETFHYIDFVVEHIASKNYSDVIPREKMQELQSLHKQFEEGYNLPEEVPPGRESPSDRIRDVHSRTTIAMGIIGPGSVGSTLLVLIRDQAAILKEEFSIDLRVMGIMDSKSMLLDDGDKGINLDKWRELLEENGEVANLEKFVQNVHGNRFKPNTVLVDCTADSVIASNYHDWLHKGIHVITPNKKANSGPLKEYLRLKALQRQSYAHYFYEATVGAGLPIISTLGGLLKTGDRILQIEGIFSGTLSYIFNNFKDGRLFSEVVAEARDAGYTEPDPRDDLSGTDVARKVIILARESGLELELSDITVKNLVPELVSASAQEFMQQLPQFDQELAEKLKDAESAEEVLRYVGVVDVRNNKGVVELRRYKKDHPFALVSGSDNMIAFTTRMYETQPLIVRGPGGAQVAAGGIFRDILRLASYLGAPS